MNFRQTPSQQFSITECVTSPNIGSWQLTNEHHNVVYHSGLTWEEADELRNRCNVVLRAVPMASLRIVADFVIGHLSLTSIPAIEAELERTGLEGEEYLAVAELLLRDAGFAKVGAPCSCPDRGAHGHHFACGYVRKNPPQDNS